MRILKHIIALLALFAVPLNAQILNTQRVSQLPVSNVWSAGDYIMFQRTSSTGQISVITEAQRFSSNLLYLSGGLLTTGQVATIASNSAYGLRSILVYTNSGPSFSETNLGAITYIINTNLSAQVLTNANSTFYQLLSGNSIKTISSDGTVTITPTSSNLILGASGGGISYATASNTAFALRTILVNTNAGPNYSVTNLNAITYIRNTNSGSGEVSTAQLLVVSNQVQVSSNSLQTQIDAISGPTNGFTGTQVTNAIQGITGAALNAATNNLAPLALTLYTNTPIPWIVDEEFDTDADDYGHLAVVHGLMNIGRANLIAVTSPSGDTNIGPAVRAVNQFFGRPYMPVGRIVRTNLFGNQTHVQDYVRTNYTELVYTNAPTQLEDAVVVLRRALASQPDKSVIMTVGGPPANVSNLWFSASDTNSALPGWQLMTNKLRELVILGGNYAFGTNTWFVGHDYNWYVEPNAGLPTSAMIFNTMSNILITFVESGSTVPKTGQSFWSNPRSSPMYLAYDKVIREDTGGVRTEGRECWGQMTASWPLYGQQFGLLSVTGRVIVNAQGTNFWTNSASGPHRYVYNQQDYINSNKLQRGVSALEGMANIRQPAGYTYGADLDSDYWWLGRRDGRPFVNFTLDVRYPAASGTVFTGAVLNPPAIGPIIGTIGANYGQNLAVSETEGAMVIRAGPTNQVVIAGPGGGSTARFKDDGNVLFYNSVTVNNGLNIVGETSVNNLTATNTVSGILRGYSGSGFTNYSTHQAMYLENGAPIFGRLQSTVKGSFGFDDGTNSIVTGGVSGDIAFRVDTNKVLFSIGNAGAPNIILTSNSAGFNMPVNMFAGATNSGVLSSRGTISFSNGTNEYGKIGLGGTFVTGIGSNDVGFRIASTNSFVIGAASGAAALTVLSNGNILLPLLSSNASPVSFLGKLSTGEMVETAAPSGGAGSQTPWVSDIDGAGYKLTNISSIILTNGFHSQYTNIAGYAFSQTNGLSYWGIRQSFEETRFDWDSPFAAGGVYRSLVLGNGGTDERLRINSPVLYIPNAGIPGAGKVLTSDSAGFATWESASGSSSTNFNVASFNNITVSNTANISNITATSLTATNWLLSTASTPGYVLAVQGDGVTIAPTNSSGGSGGSGGIVVGPSVSSNSVAGVPLYSVTALPGFTNVVAPQGKRLAGVNLVLRPVDVYWSNYYNSASFFDYITNDIALVRSAGFDTVRLISTADDVYQGTISLTNLLARYAFMVRHAASNNIRVMACTADGGNTDLTPVSGAKLTSYTNTMAVMAAMLATNWNVVGIDMAQEIANWQNDPTADLTNAVGSFRAAIKAVAPNIPVTCSINTSSPQADIPTWQYTALEPYFDFYSFNFYTNMAHGYLWPLTNSSKPFVIMEFGVPDSLAADAQLKRMQSIRQIATHPMCEGAFIWALTDQATNTVGNQWGVYANAGPTLKTNDWVRKVALTLPRNRGSSTVVHMLENPLSMTVAAGATSNAVTSRIYFKFAQPVDVSWVGLVDPAASGTTLFVGQWVTDTATYFNTQAAVVNLSSASPRLTVNMIGDAFIPENSGFSFYQSCLNGGANSLEVYQDNQNKTEFRFVPSFK